MIEDDNYDDSENEELSTENFTDDLSDQDEIDEAEIIEEPVLGIKKVNYLNNKDMLKEIHKSKNSFCEYTDPKYSDYDIIVSSIDEIFTAETQQLAKKNRAARDSLTAFEQAVINAENNKLSKPKQSLYKVDPETIDPSVLVYRVLTFEHIPLAPGRKKNPKTEADKYAKLNFYPFKHYTLINGDLTEVGRSHSYKGKFSLDHGSITHKLASMFILLVNKYSQRGNWRGYSYLEEMKGQALLQLAQMGLQFDEYKSDNPFSYYTASISNSFTRVFNLEKRNQDIRDDLLIDQGANPSFTRQIAIEEEIRRLREDAQDNRQSH